MIEYREKPAKTPGTRGTREKVILIGGTEMKLRFTMPMWQEMEDEIGWQLEDLYETLHSKGRIKRAAELASLMSGRAFTAEQILGEDDVATMKAIIDAVEARITKALTMSEKKNNDDSVHDEVLEEIEKKEPKAD